MNLFNKYILNVIRNSDESNLSKEESCIKRNLSLKEFEGSKESTNFTIHSDEVRDILESIPVKEDAIVINSYILGLRDFSEIESKLNMLPFDGDMEKIVESRLQRDLAKKIESSKKKNDNKTGNYLTIAFVILVPIISLSMIDIPRFQNNTPNSVAKESGTDMNSVSTVLCGKEVKNHISKIFDDNMNAIGECKNESKSTIVRVSALVLPTGSFDEIVIDSDNKENENLTKCMYSVIASLKSERICESVRINKTFYM